MFIRCHSSYSGHAPSTRGLVVLGTKFKSTSNKVMMLSRAGGLSRKYLSRDSHLVVTRSLSRDIGQVTHFTHPELVAPDEGMN